MQGGKNERKNVNRAREKKVSLTDKSENDKRNVWSSAADQQGRQCVSTGDKT